MDVEVEGFDEFLDVWEVQDFGLLLVEYHGFEGK